MGMGLEVEVMRMMREDERMKPHNQEHTHCD